MRPGARTVVCAVLAVLVLGVAARAETPEEKGRAIAEELVRRNQGFEDMTSEMDIVHRNANGDEQHLVLRLKVLEKENGCKKRLLTLAEPRFLKGTSLLIVENESKPDDRWVYLPSAKRVKRLGTKINSGPFSDSEISFEDLGAKALDKYVHVRAREEEYEGMTCFVVERTPKEEDAQYTKVVLWVDTSNYLIRKLDCYGENDTPWKTVTVKDYKQYEAGIWRPETILTTDHESGESAVVKWTNIKFRNGYTDRDFNVNALKRAR